MMRRYGFSLTTAAVLVLTVAGCGRKEQAAAVGSQPAPVTGAVVQVLQDGTLPELFVAVGTVRARNMAQVAARIAGTVTRVSVREGERVSRGNLLVVIEAAEQTAGAAAALAAVDEARHGLDEARSRQRLAEATHGRFSQLFQEQAVTRQELDNRQAEMEVALQGTARAEARLRQTREVALAAGAVAGHGRVTAPMSGLVTGKNVEQGMTVFPGMPLVNIDGDEGYRLEVAVPETLAGRLKPGQVVSCTVDGASVVGTGRITEIVPTADPATRTVTVKIDLAGRGLKSGQFGRASFPTETRQALLVPRSAVVERGSLTSVWVVGKDRIARMRLIKPGQVVGELVEIGAGLTAGESVVVSGVEKVTDGARIQ